MTTPIISEKTYIEIYNHLSDVQKSKTETRDSALEAFVHAYDDALELHDKETWKATIKSLHRAQIELDEAAKQFDEIEAYGQALGY